MEVINCPMENHSDAIRKVASIVLEGKTSGTTIQADGSRIYVEGSSTQLASILSLPPKPVEKGGALSCLLIAVYGLFGLSAIVGFFATAFGIVSGNPSEMFGYSNGLGCFLTILYSLITIWAFNYRKTKDRQNRVVYETEINNWERIREKWEKLYYCYKHHIVFDPGHPNEYCDPTDLVAFLSR
jgi:hypothetical protein